MKKIIYLCLMCIGMLALGSCEKSKNDVAGKSFTYEDTEYHLFTSTFYFNKNGKTCDWNLVSSGKSNWTKDISYTMDGNNIQVGSVKSFTYHVNYIEDTDGLKYYQK